MISNIIIEEVKNRLIKTYNPVEIYVFGSYAWGHPDEESDLDLLVIVDNIEDEKQRHKALVEGHLKLYDLGISKDILLFSKDEFETKAANVTTLMHTIKNKGKQIYARA